MYCMCIFPGLASNLWRHGGPTAAFVHLCTAMCFLLPSLLMEARLIHAGFLPKGKTPPHLETFPIPCPENCTRN